ncbi:MAG: hypothetical protein AAGC57_12515 [Pseudomonadota bacterium]
MRRSAWCLFGAIALAALLAAPETAHGDDCPGGDVASFGELAERLDDYDGITVLSVELLVSPSRPCRETWIVEVLTEDDEVAALLFNARTLEERFAGRALEEPDDDEDEERFPVQIVMTGGETRDLLEGDWSDDRSTGGAGGDVFVVTPGSDLIFDFSPTEDLLDVGDFARLEEGYGVLRSMKDIARMAKPVRVDGRRGTQIDIDGPVNDWSVTLLGVRPEQLTQDNVFFGLGENVAPDWGQTHWPARRIEISDGSVLFVPAYRIDEEPPDVRLVEGSEDMLELIEDRLFDLFEIFGGED